MKASGAAFRRPRWVPAAMLMSAGGYLALDSYRLGVGSASDPGPGFFPFWLSLSLAIVAMVRVAATSRASAVASVMPRMTSLSLSVKVFAILTGYMLLLIPIGFIPATVCFFTLTTRTLETRPWWRAISQAGVFTLVIFTVFYLLGVQLPAGL